MKEDFWNDDEEGLDDMVEPLGMNFHQFKNEMRTIAQSGNTRNIFTKPPLAK
jgi:hypothetical protein